MPAPHVIECPVCFATLKLKAPPKPGARLKCPKCAGVFSPDDDTPMEVVEDDDPLDDEELPVSRTKARGKPTAKKRKRKPVDLRVPILIGVAALILIGGGIGLYAARGTLANLFRSEPSVDLAYVTLADRTMFLEFRAQDYLKSPAVPETVRNGSSFGGASPGLKQLVGLEIGDIDVVQAHINAPLFMGLGFAPGMHHALAVVKCRRSVTRPTTGGFSYQGVTCYRVQEEGGMASGLSPDTMFFPNSTTVVIGKEFQIQKILDQWKAGQRPTEPAPANPGQTVYFAIGKQFLQTMSGRMALPGAFPMMGPAAGLSSELQNLSTAVAQNASEFNFGMQVSGSSLTSTLTLQAYDSSKVAPLQSAVDGVRSKLTPIFNLAMQNQAILPEPTRQSMQQAQQVLNAPIQVSGNKLSLTFAATPEKQTQNIEDLAKLMLPLGQLKVRTTPNEGPADQNVVGSAIIARHGADKVATITLENAEGLSRPHNNKLYSLIYEAGGGLTNAKTENGKTKLVVGPIQNFEQLVERMKQAGTVSTSDVATRTLTVQLDPTKLDAVDDKAIFNQRVTAGESPASDYDGRVKQLVDKHGRDKVVSVICERIPGDPAEMSRVISQHAKLNGKTVAHFMVGQEFRLVAAPVESWDEFIETLKAAGSVDNIDDFNHTLRFTVRSP